MTDLEAKSDQLLTSNKKAKQLMQHLTETEEELQNEKLHKIKLDKQRSDLARELDELTKECDSVAQEKTYLGDMLKKCDFEINRLRREIDKSSKNEQIQLSHLKKKHDEAVNEMGKYIDQLMDSKNRFDLHFSELTYLLACSLIFQINT